MKSDQRTTDRFDDLTLLRLMAAIDGVGLGRSALMGVDDERVRIAFPNPRADDWLELSFDDPTGVLVFAALMETTASPTAQHRWGWMAALGACAFVAFLLGGLIF